MTTVTSIGKPEPLGKIPHEKLQMKGQIILAGLIIGFMVSGLYFGITQVHWTFGALWQGFWLKHAWDDTTGAYLSQHVWFINPDNWSYYRHNVRDLGIPSLAIFGVMTIFTASTYTGKKYKGWRLVAGLVLFFIAFVVLVCLGTYAGLLLIDRPGALGSFFAKHDVLLWLPLGILMSWVLHHLFGPVGASLQAKWVDLAENNHYRHGGGEYPWWVRHNYLAPVTARRKFDDLAQQDWRNGSAQILIDQGPKLRYSLVWWIAGLIVPFALALAVLGFIGHIIVGVLGISVPYLAP